MVFLDEAHNNFHTAGGRYKPFADLLKNDGYAVTPNTKKFTSETLKGCEVLVVANAQGAPLMRSPEAANSAFEAAECDAVHDWVRAGGSLLLDRRPSPLGRRRTIDWQRGWVSRWARARRSTRPTRRPDYPRN